MKCVLVVGFVCFLSFIVVEATFDKEEYISDTGSSEENSEKRFKIIMRQTTWYNAYRNCHTEKKKLATIWNAEEQRLLSEELINNDMYGKKVWIGGTDKRTEGEFRWMLSAHEDPLIKYSNWAPNQPSSELDNIEDCVAVVVGFEWDDLACNKSLAFACEYFGEREEDRK